MAKISGPTGQPSPQRTEAPVQSSPTQAISKTETSKAETVTGAGSSKNVMQAKQEPKGKLAESQIAGQSRKAQLRSKLESSTLERGMRGAEVEKLQDKLIAQGYMTKDQKATGPGIFGPRTEAALKKFQQDHGLVADGIYGPKTQKIMDPTIARGERETQKVKQETRKPEFHGPKEVPDSKLNTARSLEDQAKLYDKYEKMIPDNKLKSGPNEMNILGLRHHDISSSKDLRSYDDRFVVLWKDKTGNKHAQIFEGATHTGQRETKGRFTDVNKDGKSDIAYIKPGTYEFHMGSNETFGKHLRPDANIPAWRDTNQDGRITDSEKNTNFTAGAILFHKGGTEAPKSVGCQTLAPAEYQKFIDLIGQDPNRKVTYTLADASGVKDDSI